MTGGFNQDGRTTMSPAFMPLLVRPNPVRISARTACAARQERAA